ncbi:UDP-N-acetylglucosamine 2-epimerase [Varibaculum cambriense]|uniref:UDP-N-acetylglucosamine 2-epimerase n=1 Tax=Varibaculum cambriense TaxID=184870 RepID=UPI003C6F02FA|nr:UDP-N-acetylglucosamine 2-epimerase [Varibaculum cambriense]
MASGRHGEQTEKISIAIERVLQKYQPDWVLVYGDTNSTLSIVRDRSEASTAASAFRGGAALF